MRLLDCSFFFRVEQCYSSEKNLSLPSPGIDPMPMKKSKSDLISSPRKHPSTKISQLRWSLIERICEIGKISFKQTPILFRRLSPLRPSFPLERTTSFGFSTEVGGENTLREQPSIQSFHTARESLSNGSLKGVESLRPCLRPPSDMQLCSRTRPGSDEVSDIARTSFASPTELRGID